MKLHLRVISEAPYEPEGEMARLPFKSSFISDASLARLYTPLGTIAARDQQVSMYFLKGKTSALGTIKSIDKDGLPSNRLMFSLMFKEAHTLIRPPTGMDATKILQVDSVSVDSDFEGLGIPFLRTQL